MKYDATLKRLFLSPPVKLLEMLLGQEVAVERLLPTDMITVSNMHPDLLFEAPDGRLIHLEVHGYGMPDFAVRNLFYFVLILRDYKRAPQQLVVWIGKDKPGIPSGLDFRRTWPTAIRWWMPGRSTPNPCWRRIAWKRRSSRCCAEARTSGRRL